MAFQHEDLEEMRNIQPKGKLAQEQHSYLTDDRDPYQEQFRYQASILRVLDLISLVFLVAAFAVWAYVWYKNRSRQAYRYAFLLFFLGANILFLVVVHSDAMNPISDTLNLVIIFSLTGYVVLSMIRALKKIVNAGQTLMCVMVCTLLPLWLALLRWRLEEVLPDSAKPLILPLCTMVIPNFLALLGGLIGNGVLLYWLFALDNSRYKENRDYRVIRYGSVCLLLALLYCGIVELIWVVKLHSFEKHIEMMPSFQLFAARGFVVSLLLCFLDLEVLASCPCGCIDLAEDEDEHGDAKLLGNSSVAPSNDMVVAPGDSGITKTHVTSFETEITPRLTLQSKQAYGTIQERP